MFAAPFDVVLGEIEIVPPGIVFIATARRIILESEPSRGTPDLLSEIISGSTRVRDGVLKAEMYARSRVATRGSTASEGASTGPMRQP